MTTVLIFWPSTVARTLVSKFPRRNLGRVDLLKQNIAFVPLGLKIDTHDLHAVEQKTQFFIEDEKRCLLAACEGRLDERHDDKRFARTSRS